ncbi:iron-responsive transcriptional regulator [compost metagenome]
MRRMEDDFHLVECFDPSGNNCPISPACGLKGVLGRALAAYLQVLSEYTLQDLLLNKHDLQAIFQRESSNDNDYTDGSSSSSLSSSRL